MPKTQNNEKVELVTLQSIADKCDRHFTSMRAWASELGMPLIDSPDGMSIHKKHEVQLIEFANSKARRTRKHSEDEVVVTLSERQKAITVLMGKSQEEFVKSALKHYSKKLVIQIMEDDDE